MFKIIFLSIFLTTPLMVLAEPRTLGYRINFRELAKLSAILSQCETSIIEKRRNDIEKISQEEGLKLAKKEKYTMNQIGQVVANILYDLDKKYPEQIPLSVCMDTLEEFDIYIKKIKK